VSVVFKLVLLLLVLNVLPLAMRDSSFRVLLRQILVLCAQPVILLQLQMLNLLLAKLAALLVFIVIALLLQVLQTPHQLLAQLVPTALQVQDLSEVSQLAQLVSTAQQELLLPHLAQPVNIQLLVDLLQQLHVLQSPDLQ
jgi:hypothetical protein